MFWDVFVFVLGYIFLLYIGLVFFFIKDGNLNMWSYIFEEEGLVVFDWYSFEWRVCLVRFMLMFWM